MFCNTRVVSTGASRVLDHLLGCVLCPARVKQPLQALRAETTGKRKAKDHKFIIAYPTSNPILITITQFI